MELKNERELETTREKLRMLEEHYNRRTREARTGSYAEELSLRSIKRLINQLKEEIVRYESRTGLAATVK